MPGNSQGMGFQVFDSQGRLTLNLVDKAAKVETVIPTPSGLTQPTNFPIPGVTPETHFVIPAPWKKGLPDYYCGVEVYNGGVRYFGLTHSTGVAYPDGVNLIVVRMA